MEPELAQEDAERRLQRVCAALTAADQELMRALAALLRHVLFASEPYTLDSDGGGSAASAAAEAEQQAVRALCGHCTGWLLGPLGRACAPASDAVCAFMWFLVTDDDGFR
jgi:hypothetical protein